MVCELYNNKAVIKTEQREWRYKELLLNFGMNKNTATTLQELLSAYRPLTTEPCLSCSHFPSLYSQALKKDHPHSQTLFLPQ